MNPLQQFGLFFHDLFLGLFRMFATEWVAPLVAAIMIVVAIGLGVRAILEWSLGARRALYARQKALEDAFRDVPSDEISDEQHQAKFKENFGPIKSAFLAKGRGKAVANLRRDWSEFDETLLKDADGPILNAGRPGAYFHARDYAPAWVSQWANTFVGVGLLLTFVGIVAALSQATETISASSSVAESQKALLGLLTIASSKFLTSIGGLAGSIFLKMVDHRIQAGAAARVRSICKLLERGLSHASMPRMGMLVVAELQRQTQELKTFNTDMAIAIGERVGAQFQTAMAPVTSALEGIKVSVEGTRDATVQAIRDGIGGALQDATGGQTEQIGALLRDMTAQMANSQARFESSTKAAGEAMASAAAAFQGASGGSTDAFARLTANIDSMGAAAKDAVNTQLANHENQMSSLLAQVQKKVDGATQNLQDDMKSALQDALGGVRMQVQALQEAAETSRASLAALREAAEANALASAPMRKAVEQLASAAGNIESTTLQTSDMLAAARNENQKLVTEMRKTQESLTAAWDSYRASFEGVDKKLGDVFGQMTAHLSATTDQMQRFGQEIDKELAGAVGKIGAQFKSLDNLEDYAEELSEFVKALPRVAAS